MKELSSCEKKEPFVELDPNGKAAIIDYNLPQSTCYRVASNLNLNLSPSYFKNSEKTPPKINFWTEYASLSISEIQEKLNDELNNSIQKIPLVHNPQYLKPSKVYKKPIDSSAQKVLANTSTRKSTHPEQIVEGIVAGHPVSFIANQIKKGYRPIIQSKFSKKPLLIFRPKPKLPKPQISILLHYKMCSFLGDYGAGKTLKTFSLLPGEETTITIKNFLHNEQIKTQAQNVLDSFSESSADELETLVQNEVANESSSSSSNSETSSETDTSNWNIEAGIDLGPFNIGGGYSEGGSDTISNTNTFESVVGQQMTALENALSTHVSSTDSVREIDVNSETSTTSISETEELVVRKLKNINKSRVLNFVFRQLLQEYYTVTYLDDVSIVYSNGYPSSFQRVKLSDIDTLLNKVLEPAHVSTVRNRIFTYLCNVPDYNGDLTSFIESVENEIGNCIDPDAETIKQFYVRKKKGLEQEYEGKTFNGIITNIKHRVLRTPSLIVEALLGQGEALDCYNQILQNEATINAQLENAKLKQSIDIIEGVSDAAEKAKLYKQVFGECCPKENDINPEQE